MGFPARIDRGNQVTGINVSKELTGVVPVPNLPIATGADPGISKPGAGLSITGDALNATAGGSAINQLTGDVTAGPGNGSQAASVVKVNGASVPASQAYVGTNGSGQIVAAAALSIYANNAAAILGGLAVGAFYRLGGDPDQVCVVH